MKRENAAQLADHILDLCQKENIDVIAGPVTSGVVIATACFLRSLTHGYKVSALLLGKPGYVRDKHGCGPKMLGCSDLIGNVLLVDDCICSGKAMIAAIEEIIEYNSSLNIVGIASQGIPYHVFQNIRSHYRSLRGWRLPQYYHDTQKTVEITE